MEEHERVGAVCPGECTLYGIGSVSTKNSRPGHTRALLPLDDYTTIYGRSVSTPNYQGGTDVEGNVGNGQCGLTGWPLVGAGLRGMWSMWMSLKTAWTIFLPFLAWFRWSLSRG